MSIGSKVIVYLLCTIPCLASINLAQGAEIKCTSLWTKTLEGKPIRSFSQKELCHSAWFTGEIVPGDAERMKAFLQQHQYLSTMHLISPGGNVLEAIKIARLLRDALIETSTFSTDEKTGWKNACDSACAVVALGGVSRSLSYIGLHRPTRQRNELGTFETAKRDYELITRELEAFFREIGISNSVLDRMLTTGPEGVDRIYPSSEIRKVVPDFDPAFQQWLHPRCKNADKYYVCMLEERWKEIFKRAQQLTGAR